MPVTIGPDRGRAAGRGEAATQVSHPDPDARPARETDPDERGPRPVPRLPGASTSAVHELDEPTWPGDEPRP